MNSSNDFKIKPILSEQDILALSDFNQKIHGGEIGKMTATLFRHHPSMKPDDWFCMENPDDGKIISSLCLIPWTWNFCGIELKVAEIGIVGTDESFRNLGLSSRLFAQVHQKAKERGFLFCGIQGIPFFYRQFGYHYAVPLEKLEYDDEGQGQYEREDMRPGQPVQLSGAAHQ